MLYKVTFISRYFISPVAFVISFSCRPFGHGKLIEVFEVRRKLSVVNKNTPGNNKN